MKLLLIDQRHGQSRSLELKGWLRALLSLCLLGTPVGLGYFGYQLAAGQNDDSLVFNQQSAENWQKELALQALQLEQLRSASEQELDATLCWTTTLLTLAYLVHWCRKSHQAAGSL